MKRATFVAGLGAALLVAGSASAESVSGFSKGYVYPTYNQAGVPLLDSFYFRYSDTDHHLQSLAVQPQSDGRIMLAFSDHNNDDEYFYSVEHKRRTDFGIITGAIVDFGRGKSLHPITVPSGNYVFALRGFRFYFQGDDHHIDEIGIVREGNGIRTYFNDQNDDDNYVVYVDYAWLPATMVQTTGQLSGTDDGGGVQRSLANASRAIITGFHVDFTSSDHHVQDFGVLTRTSDIQVYYADKNLDDDFRYRVDYAILNNSFSIGPIASVLE